MLVVMTMHWNIFLVALNLDLDFIMMVSFCFMHPAEVPAKQVALSADLELKLWLPPSSCLMLALAREAWD